MLNTCKTTAKEQMLSPPLLQNTVALIKAPESTTSVPLAHRPSQGSTIHAQNLTEAIKPLTSVHGPRIHHGLGGYLLLHRRRTLVCPIRADFRRMDTGRLIRRRKVRNSTAEVRLLERDDTGGLSGLCRRRNVPSRAYPEPWYALAWGAVVGGASAVAVFAAAFAEAAGVAVHVVVVRSARAVDAGVAGGVQESWCSRCVLLARWMLAA